MRVTLCALFTTVVVCAVSCAAGTTDPDLGLLSAAGSGGDAGSTPSAASGGGTPSAPSGSSGSAGPSTGDGDPAPPTPPLPSTPTPAPTSTSTSTPAPAPASQEVTGSYTLDVACADVPIIDLCLLSTEADKDVTFTLPAGTQRSSIVYTVTPQGPSAGGTVTFAGADALDGTVHLHGFADAFSSVHVEVTGVMVVPQ